MWVSKKDWEELQERVSKLEKGKGISIAFLQYGTALGHHWREVELSSIIEAILKELDCDLKVTPGHQVPTTAKLVKRNRETVEDIIARSMGV